MSSIPNLTSEKGTKGLAHTLIFMYKNWLFIAYGSLREEDSNSFCINIIKVIRQGMAPVLEMAMVAKLLMISIDSPMMWDVPKNSSQKLHHGKVAVYSA